MTTTIKVYFLFPKNMLDHSSIDEIRTLNGEGVLDAAYNAGIPHMATITFKTKQYPTHRQTEIATKSLLNRIQENYPGAKIISKDEQEPSTSN